MYMRKRRLQASHAHRNADAAQVYHSVRAQRKWILATEEATLVLAVARAASVVFNIIHDCDEVFNYWEPLHYLLYGYGMQTWEYSTLSGANTYTIAATLLVLAGVASSAFALRSYLYLLLHIPAAAPLAALFGTGKGKQVVFYGVRLLLASCSVASETWLYRAVATRCNGFIASLLLLSLCVAPGLFAASTALLPSSFTMYAITAAAAALLEDNSSMVVVLSAVGIVWGWVVAGAAFVPFALWVLFRGPFIKAVLTAAAAAAATVMPLVLVDRLFYAQWTVSLWNFVRYNVVGGGDSALYGVEGPFYYLINGALNLNLLLPLALLAPLALGAAALLPQSPREPAFRAPHLTTAGVGSLGRLAVALSPCFVWLAAISALPHKEERFLYVVYPLLCLAASVSLSCIPWLATLVVTGIARLPRAVATWAGRLALGGVLLTAVTLSLSRTTALVLNYGAPLRVYNALPEETPPGPFDSRAAQDPIHVCVGSEWYRYPSSFFLPGEHYRLQFIKSGFTGLLPRPFDPAAGGTAAASPFFNNRNQEDPANYVDSTSNCNYLVTWNAESAETLYGEWSSLQAKPFLDSAHSPQLYRVLYLPLLSAKHNRYINYTLLERVGL